MAETIKDVKRDIRRRMKLLREQLTVHEYERKSGSIAERIMNLPEWRAAETVHVYVSAVNHEVDTLTLIHELLASGKRVAVPKCIPSSRRLHHIHLQSLSELKPGKFGLLEPDHTPESEVAPSELDLIFAPLLAFDRLGGRLGFGGGYYDSLFSDSTCPRVGLAFAFQEIGRVPMEHHDGRLDTIVTETETIRVHHD